MIKTVIQMPIIFMIQLSASFPTNGIQDDNFVLIGGF